MTDQPTDIMGLGPGVPEHRDGRDLRGPYSDEPSDAFSDDVSEARLIHKLLRLGGDIPEDRWSKIDAVLDRLLDRDDLSERDAIRIAQVQAARERVIATATGKVLDKLASDKLAVTTEGNGPSVVIVKEFEDYLGLLASSDGSESGRQGVPDGELDHPIVVLPANGREVG